MAISGGWTRSLRRLAVGLVLILGPLVGLSAFASTASAHSPRPRQSTEHWGLAASGAACDPGKSLNPLYDFKVTLTCLLSGEAFRDPALKLKDDCIVKVGFDALTDLIPAAKVKLLKKAAVPIGRSAKVLASDLARTKEYDAKLIGSLDNLGKAVTLAVYNPRDVVGLFVTSDHLFDAIKAKLGTKYPAALKDLTQLQGETKKLFLALTGIDDAEGCAAAFAGHKHASGAVELSYFGRIGALTIDVSTGADVTRALGQPSYTTTGGFDNAPGVSYKLFGYGCSRSTCVTKYYVNLGTGRLESFETMSPQFALPGGIRVGMSAAAASGRERRPIELGCAGIVVTKPKLAILLWTRGGRRLSSGHISGGRVAGIAIDDRQYGVGTTFC